ncbi:MAG: hypothetical protein ACHQD8_01345 [Chitinophagales bacterium]
MPFIEEKFDQDRIDSIRRFLHREADKGRKRDFEIFVNGFKVISRTNDVTEFDDYEQEIKGDTQSISILVYDGPSTNRNTKYHLLLHGEPGIGKTLDGIGIGLRTGSSSQGALGQIIQEKLDAKEREHELTQLKEKLADTQKQLEESEEYTDLLQQQIKDLESGQLKKMIGVGDIAGYVLSGFLKQHPQIIKQIPIAGETLAGLLNAPLPEQNNPVESSETATFEKKQTAPAAEDQEERQWVQYRHQLQHCFNEQQVSIIFAIVDKLSHEPGQIDIVAQLLNIKNN